MGIGRRVVIVLVTLGLVVSCSGGGESESATTDRVRSGVAAPTITETTRSFGNSYSSSLRANVRYDSLVSCPTASFCMAALNSKKSNSPTRPGFVEITAGPSASVYSPTAIFSGYPDFMRDGTELMPRPAPVNVAEFDAQRSIDTTALACTAEKKCVAFGTMSVWPNFGGGQSYVTSFDGSSWGPINVLSGWYAQCKVDDYASCFTSLDDFSAGRKAKCADGSGSTYAICWVNRDPDVNKDHFESFSDVECPSATSCVALGSFRLSDTSYQLEIATIPIATPTRSSTVIQRLPKPPTTIDVFSGKPSFDCASVERCVVASLVADKKSFALWQSVGGVWTGPVSVPVASGTFADTEPRPDLVDCSSDGTCVVAGLARSSSNDSSKNMLFTVSIDPAGTISPYVRHSGAAKVHGFKYVASLSCLAPGSCVLAGDFSVNGTYRGFVTSQSGGVWQSTVTPVVVSLSPEADGTNADYSPVSISVERLSCSGVGSCALIGGYVARNGTFSRYSALLSGGALSPSTVLKQTGATTALNCLSAAKCYALTETNSFSAPAVLNELSITAGQATPAPTTLAATTTTRAPTTTTLAATTTAAPATPTTVPPVTETPTTTTTLPVIAVKKSISFNQIAALAGVTPSSKSSLGVTVASSSKKYCKVSGKKVVGVKAGPCTFTFTFKATSKAAKQTFTFTLNVK